jgi:hypothetical protein
MAFLAPEVGAQPAGGDASMNTHQPWLLAAFAGLVGGGPPATILGPQEPAVEARAASSLPVAVRVREEHFLLEAAPPDAEGPVGALLAPSPGAEPLGLVSWRLREDGHGREIELDVRFLEEGQRVLHVEHLEARRAKLVWRELRAAGGRSILGEWDEKTGALRVIEWGRPTAVRESLVSPGGAVLPLYLLELARAGEVEGGRLEVFDPLARALEGLRVVHRFGARRAPIEAAEAVSSEGRGFLLERLVELVRDDGTLAGSYLFSGDELLAFRWQAGGPRARRIPPEEYRERRDRLNARE